MIWQTGTPSIGYAAGVSSAEIDYDLWNDEFNFEAEWGTSPTPPLGGTMFYGRNKTALTNIRTGPGGNFSDIGDLLLNDLIEADKRQDVSGVLWWHITKITRAGVNVPLPGVECWCWGTNIEEMPPPVTEDSITVTVAENGVTKTYKIIGNMQVS
jgi:hypothetical protein